jgi:dihydrodipicolinate synthase/N-acetylneuraminate lyase
LRNPSGVIPALITPTTPKGRLDEKSLRSLVARNVEWGVQGVAVSIVAGEFYKFSDDERRRTFEVVIDEVDGRVPVWTGVNHIGTEPAIELARHAKDVGASGTITMPPLVGPRTDAAIYEHFSRQLEEVDLPAMIQDSEDFTGVHIRPSMYAQLVREHSNLVSVKIEGGDSLRRMEDVLGIRELDKLSVLGGMGARLLLQEMELGTHGTIPASCMTDFVIEVYRDFRAGRVDAARRLFARYKRWIDFLTLNSASSAEIQKETSRLRRILSSSDTRSPHVPLSNEAKKQLAVLVGELCSGKRPATGGRPD